MINNDRYYEPDDGEDYEDLDEYIKDYVAFEMREGGEYDPKSELNVCEAAGELGMSEDLDEWHKATPAEQERITEYWLKIAEYKAEQSYFTNL